MFVRQPHWTSLLLHAAVATAATVPLFQPWNTSQWVASDDRVRPGGLSQSNLEVLAPHTSQNPFDASIVRFYGTLDYEALNGSGFASQRTADDWPGLDLSAYDRIVVEIPSSDGKTYTLNIKDTVLPPLADGREQATVSWEHDFQIPATVGPANDTSTSAAPAVYEQVVVRFEDLVPTYRGRIQNDTAPLNLTGIKRVNLMIRR